jgi:hypothetical protein
MNYIRDEPLTSSRNAHVLVHNDRPFLKSKEVQKAFARTGFVSGVPTAKLKAEEKEQKMKMSLSIQLQSLVMIQLVLVMNMQSQMRKPLGN